MTTRVTSYIYSLPAALRLTLAPLQMVVSLLTVITGAFAATVTVTVAVPVQGGLACKDYLR